MSEHPIYDHPGIAAVSRWLDPNPNLPPELYRISQFCADLKDQILSEAGVPSAELTAGLRKLLEAKDCFVRAKLFDQETQAYIDARDKSTRATKQLEGLLDATDHAKAHPVKPSRDETEGRGNVPGE